jgi:hypothetical protein
MEGSVPKHIPPSFMFGQEILASSPAIPSTSLSFLASSVYSATDEPKKFTITGVLNLLRKDIFSETNVSNLS